MKVSPILFAAAGTLFSLVQLTPAPINLLVSTLAGGVAAGTMGQIVKHAKRVDEFLVDLESRDEDLLAGLPKLAADDCKAQLKGTTVTFAAADNNGVRIDNVPSSCMTLANVFLGQNPNQPAPTPMGSASLEYHNLADDQLHQLQAVLDRNQGH
ncbi:hypothetical protein N7492_003444 [Penicillium capsulatum]|uniref:Uncharacterized protein n=1 Tax=Penicillium capsulatum TaxID=69766 RepID=A0A9W9LWZ3_9EURO|nr:hypothetical protein N7492_003444 [Penicillium capsulatum]KAJ6121973.1 hypothetical protein N7512_004438 [Penicillium capsulatum]